MKKQTNDKYAVVLLGPPGSGKTTIAGRLAKEEQFEHVETGKLLREESRKQTKLGAEIKSYLKSGKPAPTKIVVKLLDRRLEKSKKYVAFDGSPRREEEIVPFLEEIHIHHFTLIEIPVFEVSRDTACKRLTGRQMCPNCGLIYNSYYKPPKHPGLCDKCGSNLVQRTDDKPEIVDNRFKEFDNNTKPVIEYFEKIITTGFLRSMRKSRPIGISKVRQKIQHDLSNIKQ